MKINFFLPPLQLVGEFDDFMLIVSVAYYLKEEEDIIPINRFHQPHITLSVVYPFFIIRY